MYVCICRYVTLTVNKSVTMREIWRYFSSYDQSHMSNDIFCCSSCNHIWLPLQWHGLRRWTFKKRSVFPALLLSIAKCRRKKIGIHVIKHSLMLLEALKRNFAIFIFISSPPLRNVTAIIEIWIFCFFFRIY